MIKTEFRLNMYNDSLFKWFENNKREGFQFHMFPKFW